MQRRVLLGAGAAILVVAALAGLKVAGYREATHVLNTDIDRIAASLPPGYTATHGATDVNPITGSLTIHTLAVSLAGKLLWSADSLTITGADQQALHDVFDPAAYPNGHPAWSARRLLIADVSAAGVLIPGEGPDAAAIRIKSVTLHQLRGRPFQSPPGRDQLSSPAFRADTALAFALQGLDLHDIALQAQPPRPARFTIAAVTLRDYDGGRIGKAAVSHFALDAAADKPTPVAVHATIDSIEARNLNAAGPLRHLQLNEPLGQSGFAGLNEGDLTLAGLGIDITPGPRITLAGLEAHGSAGGAGEANFQDLTLALKDTPLAPVPAALVAAFGMRTITLDIDSKTSTDPATGHARFAEDLVFHDLGALHLSLAGNLDLPTGPARNPQAALMSVPIDHAELQWRDLGFVGRALNVAAAQMHTTPDLVRAQLAMPLLALGFLMPDQPDLADQLTGFLKNPNTLTVTLDPPQPVTLAEVGHAPAEARAHLLGARIHAN